MSRSDTLSMSLRARRLRTSLKTLRRDCQSLGDAKLEKELDTAIQAMARAHDALAGIAPEPRSWPMSLSLTVEMLETLRREARTSSKNQSLVIRNAIEAFLDTHEGPLPPEEETTWDARISTRLPMSLLSRVHERAARHGVTKSVILRLALADMRTRLN